MAGLLKGQTVHSSLKFDIHLKHRLVKGTGAAAEVSQVDLVIIDEVSKGSAGMLEGPLHFVADPAGEGGKVFGLLLGNFFQSPATGGQAAPSRLIRRSCGGLADCPLAAKSGSSPPDHGSTHHNLNRSATVQITAERAQEHRPRIQWTSAPQVQWM